MNKDLRADRLNRGLSLRKAARDIGVPESVLRRAEGGEGLHPGNAYKVASFYGYQVTDVWPLEEAGAA